MYYIIYYTLTTLKNAMKLKVLSLFSGCGGLDLGVEGGFLVHKECIHATSDTP